MVSRQCILAMELKDIGREKFDGSQAKRQIRQYFPPSILRLQNSSGKILITVCFYADTTCGKILKVWQIGADEENGEVNLMTDFQ